MMPHAIRNVTVEDAGKTYRIAFHGTRALVVAQKLPKGGERLMYPDKRRAKELIRKARQLPPQGAK